MLFSHAVQFPTFVIRRKMSNNKIGYVNVVAPRKLEKPSGIVVFLHGSGDTGDGVREWVADTLKSDLCFPHLQVMYPTAPIRPYTPNNGSPGTYWFDRLKISPTVPDDLETVDPMGRELQRFIEKQVELGVPMNRIIIGGFSMGGAMALHTAYRFCPQVAGVFGLSAFLNDDSVVYKDIQSNKGTLPPLFMTHGTQDMLVLPEWGRKTYERLRVLEVKVQFHPIENSFHVLTSKSLKLLQEWILKILPEQY